MKNSKTLFHDFVSSITLRESRDEIESIAYIILEDLFALEKTRVLAETPVDWTDEHERKLMDVIYRINQGEPVQYLVGSAIFYGRRFFVDDSVLIPRPETEELVQEVIDFVRTSQHKHDWRILDIGTGSGCIPITCAVEIPGSTVMATDISENAIAMARKNILHHKVPVQLLVHDVLIKPLPFRDLDIVISNPPYIPDSERSAMPANVVEYEPHLALFVDREDPFIFYKAITEKAKVVLNPGGIIAFETHEQFAGDVAEVLISGGFSEVDIIRDTAGKQRIVKAIHQTP